MNQKRRTKGFTLVEIAIVIGVISILAAVLVPAFVNILSKAKDNSNLEKVTSIRDDLFFNDPDLATISDMRGYIFKVGDTIYKVSSDGDIVESDYDSSEYDFDNDYISVPDTSSSGIGIYKPTAVSALERAKRARNHYHTKHSLLKNSDGKGVFFEMNHFIITVYDNKVGYDVNFEVVYSDDGQNGDLIPTGKTIEELKEQGLIYTLCTCSECSGSSSDTWEGDVYVPTQKTIVALRILELEELIPNDPNIQWDDGNIKKSNFVYLINGDVLSIDSNDKVYYCDATMGKNSKVQPLSTNDSNSVLEKLAKDGYAVNEPIYSSVISNIEKKVKAENVNSDVYKPIQCYAIRYGYYDSEGNYNTWTKYKSLYNNGNDVTEIAYKEEMSEYDISKLVICDTVTKICDSAFVNYGNLTEIVLPESLLLIESLTKNPFANGKLTSIKVNDRNTIYSDVKESSVIRTDREYVYDEDLEEDVLIETNTLIRGSSAILTTENTLPKDIAIIGNYAFENTDLEVIDITNNQIGKGIFKDCKKLETVAHSLTIIPDETFSGCEALNYITEMKNLTQIGTKAFKGCKLLRDDNINGLVGLMIPNTLAYIGENAFEDCINDTEKLKLFYSSSRNTFKQIVGYENAYNSADVTIIYALKDITYDLKDGKVSELFVNPTYFNPNSTEELEIHSPEKEGFIFRCWKVKATDDNTPFADLTYPYILKSSEYGGNDITLTANYEQIIFNITYVILGNDDLTEEINEDPYYPKKYDKTSDTMLFIPDKSKNYYDFDGWYVDGKKFIGYGEVGKQSDFNQDMVLTATLTPTEYKITYDYAGGTAKNRQVYTIETETFTIEEPVKQDYTFKSWEKKIEVNGSQQISYPQSITITKGDIPYDIYLVAIYEATIYKITYELNGADRPDGLPTQFTVENVPETLILPKATKRGYKFISWKVGGDDLVDNKFVCKDYHQDTIITAIFTPNEYTIEYHAQRINTETFEDDIMLKTNNVNKCIFDSVVPLNDPSLKTGYRFLAWYDLKGYCVNYDSTDGSYELRGMEDDLIIIAKFEIIKYPITYEIYGATETIKNPEYYTVETETITLNDVEKAGYTFNGWTGSNGNTPERGVQIDCANSIGAKNYYAQLTPNIYTITYRDLFDSVVEDNPTEYTVETNTFTLNNPERAGYRFDGWTGTNLNTNSLQVVVERGQYGDRTYQAHWTIIHYVIGYDLNDTIGKVKAENNINNFSSYTVEDEDITILPATRRGYSFLGWTGSNGLDPQIEDVVIPARSTGNKNYVANWKLNIYELEYELNVGILEAPNKATYTVEDEAFTLRNPTKTGYKFLGWTGTGLPENSYSLEVKIEAQSVGNRSYTSCWKIIEYTIQYNYNGGEVSIANPELFTVETSTFTLNNPEKRGYRFDGWTGTNDSETVDITTPTKPITIEKGSIGNRTYLANWTAIEYTITLILDGGETPSGKKSLIYTVETPTFMLEVPTKRGFTFEGYTIGDNLEPQTNVTILQGSIGNRIYTAKWYEIIYTITYILNDGILANPNPDQYTVTSENIVLNNPSKLGYKFLGWEDKEVIGNYETYIVIETGSIGDKIFEAKWEIIEYRLNYQYNLENITLEKPNPGTYFVTTDTFTLYNPSKRGYTFTGWTGYHGNDKLNMITIMQGSVDDRTYIANWEINKYIITYDLQQGEFSSDTELPPALYTVEDEVTIPRPERLYYRFDGWTGRNTLDPSNPITIPQLDIVIAKGTIGDFFLEANWTLIRFNISYTFYGEDGNDDTGIPICEDLGSFPDHYMSTDPSAYLINPTRPGYEFLGWSGTDINGYAKPLEIKTGEMGDKDLTANWIIINYSIVYDIQGGSISPNPDSYTIRTPSFILNNPTRTGYTFDGWTGSNGTSPQDSIMIAQGSTGNFEFVANYTAKIFGVKLRYNNGTDGSDTITVTYGQPLPNATLPARTGYDFKGYFFLGTQYYTSSAKSARNWNIDLDTEYRNYIEDGLLPLDGDWKAKQFTITLNANGGSNGTTTKLTATYDQVVPKISDVAKRNYYILNGYYTASSGGDKYHDANGNGLKVWQFIEGKTFYAQWTPIEYTITYNYNGGSANNPSKYTPAQSITLNNPTRDGYVFEGWSGTGLSGSGNKKVTIAKESAGNRSYTAHWSQPIGETSGEFYATSNGTNTAGSKYPKQVKVSWSRTYAANSSSTISFRVEVYNPGSPSSFVVIYKRWASVTVGGSTKEYSNNSQLGQNGADNGPGHGTVLLSGTDTFAHGGTTTLTISVNIAMYAYDYNTSNSGSWSIGNP